MRLVLLPAVYKILPEDISSNAIDGGELGLHGATQEPAMLDGHNISCL